MSLQYARVQTRYYRKGYRGVLLHPPRRGRARPRLSASTAFVGVVAAVAAAVPSTSSHHQSATSRGEATFDEARLQTVRVEKQTEKTFLTCARSFPPALSGLYFRLQQGAIVRYDYATLRTRAVVPQPASSDQISCLAAACCYCTTTIVAIVCILGRRVCDGELESGLA